MLAGLSDDPQLLPSELRGTWNVAAFSQDGAEQGTREHHSAHFMARDGKLKLEHRATGAVYDLHAAPIGQPTGARWHVRGQRPAGDIAEATRVPIAR